MTTVIDNKNDPSAPCAAYSLWMQESVLPRALMQGTRGMKLGRETFLTKNAMESDTAYDKRLEASTLLNAFRKTTSFLAGQVFQSDVIFSEEVPEEFVDLSTDIDGKGNSLHVFAKRLFINGLGKGASHILVDAPALPTGTILTKEQEKEQNIRPYFKEVRAEDLIGYRFLEDGTLDNLRIAETVDKPDGKFGTKTVNRVRAYYSNGDWELYEQSDTGYNIVQSGQMSYKGITLVSFIPGEETSIISGETPLMDLAELNLHHWRSSSDQINILHIGRVPLLFGRNITADKIPVGTATMISSDEDNSDLKFVEISGAAIASGAVDIKENEAKMALYGLQQLVPRTGSITATEKAITSGESQSSLGTWAVEFESAMQMAFEIFGSMMGTIFPAAGIKVNKEYNFGIANDQELTALLKANEQGILSDQATFTEFKKRGVVDEHLVWDDIKAEIDADRASDESVKNLSGTLFGNTGA